MLPIRGAALCGFFLLVPALARGEDMAPVALNSLSQPPKLGSAPVLDQQGHLLGHADQMVTDQDGKPAGLSIRLQNGKTTVVSAAAVSYDGHTLVTSSDQPQIVALTQPQRTAAAR
ncbi:MAG TPA: hypothetical protein VFI23_17090 [Rhizomicrobium sp.]|nr:hypothetical protein [Rhizomicrobium sp.]